MSAPAEGCRSEARATASPYPQAQGAPDSACLAAGLCAMLTSWLDEEWTPLEVHRALATEAASAYAALRAAGERDVASILLSLSSQLLSFNYRETFTDAFEVRQCPARTVVAASARAMHPCRAVSLGTRALPRSRSITTIARESRRMAQVD